MAQITYDTKVALYENSGIADINKVKAADMNEIKSAVNDNDNNISTLQTNVSGLQTTVSGLEGTVLWTNPNPNNSFASQNITLSSADYDILEIYVKQATANLRIQSTKLLKGYDGMLYTEFDTGLIARRLATRVSDTVYTIGNVQSTAEYTNNTNIIPLYVIGYKTTIFS